MTILIRTPVSESAVGSLNQYDAVIAASKTIAVTDGLTSTYIERADTDGNQQFLLSNEQVPAGATINSITWSGELEAVGTPKYQPRFTINGELQSGTATFAPNTLETRTEAITVKDTGGLAFTVADVNAECFIRARNSSTSAGQRVQFSDLRLIIDYTEGPNLAPVADDETYSIQSDAQNNDVIATYAATDPDGTIASYSIDGAVLGIHATTGVISLLDNAGLVAGTPITATVTATDDDGATDTALITVNVTAPTIQIDSITAGGKLDAPVPQRIFWACLEGAIAIALLYGGGKEALSALQAGAITTGLPFTVILIVMSISLFKGLQSEMKHQ